MKRLILYKTLCMFLVLPMSATAYLEEILDICEDALYGRRVILSSDRAIKRTTLATDEPDKSPRSASQATEQINHTDSEMQTDSFKANSQLLRDQLSAINCILTLAYRMLSETGADPTTFFKSTKSTAELYLIENEPQNFNVSNIWLDMLHKSWKRINIHCERGLKCKEMIIDESTEDRKIKMLSSIEPILHALDQKRKPRERSSKRKVSGSLSFTSLTRKNGSLRKCQGDLPSSLVKPEEIKSPRKARSTRKSGTDLVSQGNDIKKRSSVPPAVSSVPPAIPQRNDIPSNGCGATTTKTPDRPRVQSVPAKKVQPIPPIRNDLETREKGRC